MHKKEASEAPRTRFRACKNLKIFSGGMPPDPPPKIYIMGPAFCICPGPLPSSRRPCVCMCIFFCMSGCTSLALSHCMVVSSVSHENNQPYRSTTSSLILRVIVCVVGHLISVPIPCSMHAVFSKLVTLQIWAFFMVLNMSLLLHDL